MALIPCPECGREISDKAVACPHCGLPLPKPKTEAISPATPKPATRQSTPGGSTQNSRSAIRESSAGGCGCLTLIWGVLVLIFVMLWRDQMVGPGAKNNDGAWGLAFYGIPAVLITFYILGRKAARVSSCPNCSIPIRIEDHLCGTAHCGECQQYSCVQSGYLTVVPADFIAERPVFEVPNPGGDPRQWDWPWPEGLCCVCGSPASRTLTCEAQFVSWANRDVLGATTFEITPVTLQIPHCQEHQWGVRVGPSFNFVGGSSPVVGFRSYANWMRFVELHAPRT